MADNHPQNAKLTDIGVYKASREWGARGPLWRSVTQTLLAALEIASGKVLAHVKQRRTSVNFIRFLGEVVAAFPQRELHIVLDNLNIHWVENTWIDLPDPV